MSDPLSISAGVAGLISLGLQVSSGLIQYYESWKDSEDDITITLTSLEALFKTFHALNERILVSSISKKGIDLFAESVISCAGAIQRLEHKLKKAQSTKPGLNATIRRAQYPFREKTLAKMRNIVSELRSNLSLALDALVIETTTKSLHELEILGDKVDVLVKTSVNDECLEALKWLTPLDFHSKHSDVLRRRQTGSGKWFLENRNFLAWMEAENKVLWCPGMPGAGKTILSSIIIDHLQTKYTRQSVGVAYIYCVYNEGSQTTENLLGSLLQQLAQQNSSVFEKVKSLKREYAANGTPPKPPVVSDISAVLSKAIQIFQKTYIIIDALDECSEDSGIRRDFALHLRRYLPNVRLLVTSRHIQGIEASLEPHFCINVHAEVEEVRSFITAQIDLQPRLASILKNDKVAQKAVVDSVTEKTNGMWLLAALHMDSLAQEDNIRDLKANLQNLPEGIDATYDELMRRIQKQGLRPAARAEQMLTLINCAFRPLTVQEVLCALTVRQDDTFFDADGTPKTVDLLSACCGLVILEEESQVFRLVHYTAEAYFRQRGLFKDPEAHERVTGVLLNYINCLICKDQNCVSGLSDFGSAIRFDNFVQIRGTDLENMAYALCAYAVDQWSRHARRASKRGRTNNETHQSIDQQKGREKHDWDVEKSLLSLSRNGVQMPYTGRYPYHILVCDIHPNTIHFLPKFASFPSYASNPKEPLDRSQELATIIRSDLSERDQTSGYIYICKPHGDVGLIKIGSTTRNIAQRLDEWAKQCGHVAHLEYPELDQIHRFPHLARLEALVYADLGETRRVEMRCAKCGLRHTQWFETAVPTAIAAVKKWSEWLQKEPYETRYLPFRGQTDSNPRRWSLKDEHRRNLPDLLKQSPTPESLQSSQTRHFMHSDTWFMSQFLRQLGPHTLIFTRRKNTRTD